MTMTERIEIKATDGTVVYSGDVEDMPKHDYFVDAYEEVVNQRKSTGTLGNGWTYTVRRS
jgi:pyruvate carboxylase